MNLPEFKSDIIDEWKKNQHTQEKIDSLDNSIIMSDETPNKEILQSLEDTVWKILGDNK